MQIRARFEGTSCAARFAGHGLRLGAYIDDSLVAVLALDSSRSAYPVCEGLRDTVHSLLIVNRFEAYGMPAVFHGLILDSARGMRALPPRPPYRIEFAGGSLLTGFGVHSTSITCPSIRDSSNAYLGFGPVAARELNAEYSIVAVSGKGLVREWEYPFLSTPKPFGRYYNQVLCSRRLPRRHAGMWDPHVVVLCVGLNDFSSTPQAPGKLFRARYRALIHKAREGDSRRHVVCVTGEKEPLRTHVEAVVAREREDGNKFVHFLCYGRIPDNERGCNWHPNAAGHRRIAAPLVTLIGPLLGTAE
ncbi:MAG: hypothetical protein GF410_09865 [Chitinivibrionales bacterium]|nr:hypothetical protein [Chitinivibrionales bacterium]